jgi:hypothetical protein
MSIPSWLKERFGQRVLYEEGFLVRSGSLARYGLRADPGFIKSISAIRTLAKRHVPLLIAKRAVERLMIGQQAEVDLPMLEDAALFEAELRELGIRAVREVSAAAEG